VIFVEHVEQREYLCELISRDLSVAVRIQKLQQTLTRSRASAATSTKTRAHRIPLGFIDEAIVVRIEPVEHLRRKLAGELIAANFSVLVLVKIGKVRQLKLTSTIQEILS
jgi:hypothetical protein